MCVRVRVFVRVFVRVRARVFVRVRARVRLYVVFVFMCEMSLHSLCLYAIYQHFP